MLDNRFIKPKHKSYLIKKLKAIKSKKDIFYYLFF